MSACPWQSHIKSLSFTVCSVGVFCCLLYWIRNAKTIHGLGASMAFNALLLDLWRIDIQLITTIKFTSCADHYSNIKCFILDLKLYNKQMTLQRVNSTHLLCELGMWIIHYEQIIVCCLSVKKCGNRMLDSTHVTGNYRPFFHCRKIFDFFESLITFIVPLVVTLFYNILPL